jgi:hypothetical protein
MSKNRRAFFFIILNLIVINGVILAVMNWRYPIIGHDYTLAIPSMLDTALHFRINGLSIQWFTPTFGGGIPAFPNPNNMQYSLQAILSIFLAPWLAVMLSVIIYVSIGFLACYYFFRRTLQWQWTSSVLGAFFFSANGFVITRMTTGQLGYFSFPLLAIFLIMLLDNSINTGIAVAGLALLVAVFIHSAGYFILIIFGLSILMILPMLYIYKPEIFCWKKIFLSIAVGGLVGLIISISKLSASYAFMRYFPRLVAENYETSFYVGMIGILMQLLGTQNLVPISLLGGLNPDDYPTFTRAATGTHYGMWELDMSMTPVVFIILLICAIKFLHNPKKYLGIFTIQSQKIALLIFFLFTWMAIEFTLAKGIIYPVVRNLPILSSLRGNVRFAGAFIFPVALFAAAVYNHWIRTWSTDKIWKTFLLANLAAMLSLGSYFLFRSDMFYTIYNVNKPQSIFEEMNAGQSFEITTVGSPPGKNTGALIYRESNLNLYEPVFGFKLENFHPQVKPGSVWEIIDGYYNLTDPTGYVYPALNHNKPFDRFRLEDKGTMELFVKHIQPAWKIPTYQLALDKLSLITLLLTASYLGWQIIIKKSTESL